MITFNDDKQQKQLDALRHEEEEELLQMLSKRYSLPYVDLSAVSIETDALRMIPEDEAKEAKAAAVLQVVEEQLYTPVGLRTLPNTDEHYIPAYGGDQWHRDSAYHQGTVWSWLLGPYVYALISVNDFRDKAQKVINDFAHHLDEACIGSVSEIFDADAPYHPRGCFAQAWGVAEILRVIKQYDLGQKY